MPLGRHAGTSASHVNLSRIVFLYERHEAHLGRDEAERSDITDADDEKKTC